MKFRILILATVVASTIFSSCGTEDVTLMGNWVGKAFLEGRPRGEGTSFAINDFGYFGMGKDDDGYLTDFWKYDPAKDAWSQVADFPGTPRAYNISVSNGKKGFVGLGYDGDNDLADFWEYDAAGNSWKQIKDFEGGARRYAAAFAIGSDIYVGTGLAEDGTIYTNDFYKFDGANWSKTTTLSGEKRRNANAIGFNGKGYIISGYHNYSLADFWEYDPTTQIWTKLTSLTDEDYGSTEIPRWNAATFVANDKIFLVGGTTGSTLTTIFEWDPTTITWTQKTGIEYGNGREGVGSFVLNGNGYIVGGHSGASYFDYCTMFQPDAEKDTDD
ncbi:MAG: Kelch repeat-containing protein [Prolixibacteraceae bacterium]